MTPHEREQLLAAIGQARAEILTLDEVPIAFALGAYYGLDEAERIVRRLEREHPTCLIECRQTVKEEA